ncbi:MLO-like protein 1 [Tanacetum coccineum]
MAGGDAEGVSLEFTPTWVVAAVCTLIVGISLAVERLLHYAGKKLKKAGQKPLFEALQKIKEVEMRRGFSEFFYMFVDPLLENKNVV